MSSKPLVMIVEDEEEMADLLSMRLQQAGFDVKVFPEGNRFMRELAAQRPFAVVLDVMLPGLSGYHLCRMIKFDSRYREIRVVIYTARAGEEEKNVAAQVKADAFVSKSDGFEPVVAFLQEVLDSADPSSSSETSA